MLYEFIMLSAISKLQIAFDLLLWLYLSFDVMQEYLLGAKNCGACYNSIVSYSLYNKAESWFGKKADR